MKRPLEPGLWLLFSAGGMLSALLMPSLLFLFGLAFPLGWAITPSDPNEIRSFPADGFIATGEVVQICP